ncbi:MAG: ABC transporter transmembrane domain-containing protein [Pseudomonadota bacterium]
MSSSAPKLEPIEDSVDAKAPPRRSLKKLKLIGDFIKRYPRQLSFAVIALFVAVLATLSVPSALGRIVDKGFGASNEAVIDQYFLGLIGVVIVLALATALRFYYVTWLGERVVADIRIAVHSNLLTLSPSFFEENRPSEIASRLTADTTLIQTVVGSSASIALRNFLMAVLGTVYLAYISPKLMAMIALVIPAVIIPIIVLGRRVRNLSRKSQDRIADVGAMADEALSALNVVQAFTHEPIERDRFTGAVNEAFETAKKRTLVRSLMTATVIFLIFGAIAFVLWQGAKDVIAGRMTGGVITEFIFAAAIVAGAYGALIEVYGDLMRAAGAAGRLGDLMTTEPTISAPAEPQEFQAPVRGHIQIEGLSFRYPAKQDIPALKNFTLDIAPGETVALVGPSGAGKSTVFQLLQRFYDPQTGQVRIDGVPIETLDPRNLRANMALVPQETVIFAASARENILYGRPEATEAEIIEAARDAVAIDYLEALPEGLDTYLGDKGVRLSGGQRQRLAIARAILRDAPILLLDEATSSLDTESEKQVQKALERLMKGRTTLVIAHRLSTVLRADRILVMEDGEIVAEGTHKSLMDEDGLYARLARLQFETDDVA